MTDDLLAEAKSALRKRVLSARASCGDGHSDQLIDYVHKRELRTVAAYANFGTEPSTQKFLEWAAGAGVVVLLPRIRNETDLDWCEYTLGNTATGLLGIVEPTGESRDLSEAQVVFVPAVAIGLDRSRLGRGKGFYDRALESVRVPILGLVHDAEVFETVPHDSQDVPVTGIITCTRTLELN